MISLPRHSAQLPRAPHSAQLRSGVAPSSERTGRPGDGAIDAETETFDPLEIERSIPFGQGDRF